MSIIETSSTEKIILGIDPGTQILGYSVLEIKDNVPKMLVMDVLYLKKIPDFNLRIRRCRGLGWGSHPSGSLRAAPSS